MSTALLFIIVPGRAGWLDGIPLGQLHELLFLTGAALLAVFLPGMIHFPGDSFNRRFWRIVYGAGIACVALKIILGFISLPYGLRGYYYVPAKENGIIQRSTDFFRSMHDGTRIDENINFISAGYSFNARPFHLWFFNDAVLFNDSRVDPTTLPFEAVWTGYIYIPAGQSALRLTSDGATSLAINGSHIYDGIIPVYSRDRVMPIHITYIPSSAPNKFLRLSWSGAPRDTISSLYFSPDRYSIARVKSDYLVGIIDSIVKATAIGLFLFVIAALAVYADWKTWFRSRWPFTGAASVVSIYYLVSKSLLSAATSAYFNFLPAGNDPLLYESFARHIQFTGDWLMQMKELGSYYWQILYYYLLAIIHLIVGESLFPIIFLQTLSLVGTAWLTYEIAFLLLLRKDQPTLIWHLLLLPLFFFVALHPILAEQALMLFPIGTFLVVMTVFFLLRGERAAQGGKRAVWWCVIAGCIFGAAVLMRTNFVSFLPFILIWIGVSFRRWLPALLLFLAGLMIIISPFVIRNKIIAGEWRLISRSSSTISFVLGNPIPQGYVPSSSSIPPAAAALLDKVFDGRAQPTLQWIFDEPEAYARLFLQKTSVLIGLSERVTAWLWLPFVLFCVASLLFLVQPRLFAVGVRRKDYLLLGSFVWTQLIMMGIMSVVFQRYFLPALPFLLLFSLFIVIPIGKIAARAGFLSR